MFVLGLTGSIGMGKSTVSGFFKEANIPVWDADSTVHKLYSPGGKAVEAVGKEFPAAVFEGGINRAELSKYVVGNQVALKLLESIVHPLVAEDRNTFLAQAVQEGHKLAVVDIPLLYESGGEASVDAVAVVSAPEEVQRARVLARPGMTQEKLEAILARQVPDAEKRKRADFIIDAGTSLEATRQAVSELISQLQCREGRVMQARAEPSAAL